MENLGCQKEKLSKNNALQKSRIANSEYSPSSPVEIQYSCGFSAYHLPKNRAYVLNLATGSLPLPRSLAR
ncbi:hypothetical protein OFN40_32130, partial [Escherichia coli]|nr:hypothetical protein [Escherichia coli]